MSHDARLEQAADVYALGALDGAELAEFEAHLASGCAACAERLRETREALALMPRALPQVAAAARSPGAGPRARRGGAARGGRARRSPAGASPWPRPLVGGLGGAGGGGRPPGRRQRRAVEDAGGDPGSRGAGRRAPGRARRARAGRSVPVRPERALREPGRTQADAGGERVAPLEPGDPAGPPPRARPAGRARGKGLRALGARGRPARPRGRVHGGCRGTGAPPPPAAPARTTPSTPSRSRSSLPAGSPSRPGRCTSTARSKRGQALTSGQFRREADRDRSNCQEVRA